ncbi:MerR family transcriptional regulator [Sphingobium sp. SCG-1]|uniref:MerR family transcriptional regulator n=1 Tax=Sphingobium sp. SCG-1 TaxID=2072936 RepID=UPI000CD6B7A0|nr:MerR family transcriptional regulator [Sphingobium sp. SCG-1]AUW59240.1 MerR family transcriptional regulator [Sphingobium sp. SCG-1]
MIVMKAEGAFLTIGELSATLGVPQHILRYWESRFPQLRPLQRSGNRRYYRPGDVELARRIHRLLNVEGFTIRGAQKALGEGQVQSVTATAMPASLPSSEAEPQRIAAPPPSQNNPALVAKLEAIRDRLAAALG